MLGATSQDDFVQPNSRFSKNNLKDVTYTMKNTTDQHNNANEVDHESLKDIVVPANISSVAHEISLLRKKMPSFDPERFVKNAKNAIGLIIDYSNNEEFELLAPLLDEKYIIGFNFRVLNYIHFISDDDLKTQISEIYTFGNNVFIKILYTRERDDFSEEWTYLKSLITDDINWRLTKIESNKPSWFETLN
jgi:predicted lipid-binding transport protein (Tim44 family)